MTAKKSTNKYLGVSVTPEHQVKRGLVYKARYTLPDGRRPVAAVDANEGEAFRAAVALQKEVEQQGYLNPEAAKMTFAVLVEKHYRPVLVAMAPKTRATKDSHLGNVEGTPSRTGAEAERQAKYSLLAYFGKTRINAISPQMVTRWQAELVAAGYKHASVLAKVSALNSIMAIAVANGWLRHNPCAAVARPKEVQTTEANRSVSVSQWEAIRAEVTSETVRLLLDTQLWAGLRHQGVSALRPKDVMEEDGIPLLYVRQANNTPGRRYSRSGEAFDIDPAGKGGKWHKVAIRRSIYDELLAYIDKWQLTPDALIFDFGRARAEHYVANLTVSKRSVPIPTGRYVSPVTGRSGEHNKATTYDLGCRCIPCRNQASERRFWQRRRAGVPPLQPWADPAWVSSRSSAVDPIPSGWLSTYVWRPALKRAGIEAGLTPHGLRHAMVNWSLMGGAAPRDVQRDAAHAKMQTLENYIDALALAKPNAGRLAAQEKHYDKEMAATTTTPAEEQPGSLVDAMFNTFISTLSQEEKAALVTQAMSSPRHLRAVE